MVDFKKDYSEAVKKLRDSLFGSGIREIYTIEEDALLIAKVLNVLANEESMHTSRAEAILKDAKTILPFISTI